jgi:hypothetical protein
VEIEINVDRRVMRVEEKEFKFVLSELEAKLWLQGGMSKAFAKWGKHMLEEVTRPSKMKHTAPGLDRDDKDALQW